MVGAGSFYALALASAIGLAVSGDHGGAAGGVAIYFVLPNIIALAVPNGALMPAVRRRTVIVVNALRRFTVSHRHWFAGRRRAGERRPTGRAMTTREPATTTGAATSRSVEWSDPTDPLGGTGHAECPPAAPSPIGLPFQPVHSWLEAERRARDWMVWLGFHDAALTSAGGDFGLDVIASRAVAQVKYQESSATRPQLQALVGEASHRGVRALFFSVAGYTTDARVWADTRGVALFHLDSASGSIRAENPAGAQLVASARSNSATSWRRTRKPTRPQRSQTKLAQSISKLEGQLAANHMEALALIARRRSHRQQRKLRIVEAERRRLTAALQREQNRLLAQQELANLRRGRTGR